MNLENNFLDLIRKLKKRTFKKEVFIGEKEIIKLNNAIWERINNLAVKDQIIEESESLLKQNSSALKWYAKVFKYSILIFAIFITLCLFSCFNYNKINYDIIKPSLYKGTNQTKELWNLYYQKANVIYKDLVKENYENKVNISFFEYAWEGIKNNTWAFPIAIAILFLFFFLMCIGTHGMVAHNDLVDIFERLYIKYKKIIENDSTIINFFMLKKELKTLDENIDKISINGGVNQYQNKKYVKSVNDIKKEVKSLEEKLEKKWITNDDLLFYKFLIEEEEGSKIINLKNEYNLLDFIKDIWFYFIISSIMLWLSFAIAWDNDNGFSKLEKIDNILKEDLKNNKINEDIAPYINFMVETKNLKQKQKEEIILINIWLGRDPYKLTSNGSSSISKSKDDLELIEERIKNIELLN